GRIARGGMAEIYLAREPGSDGRARHVVLKRVLPEREDDAAFLQMFRDEAAMATRLYHPNICHVYECGEIESHTFMTLEWVYGATLRKLIRRAARADGIPVRIACHLIARIAGALDYVHGATGVDGRALDIIHRDVSPHNIMLGWDGRVKLLDFGIAKTSSDETDTEDGVLKGKYAYLAPEQARGERLDKRVDIFALGVVFYETLTCRPLYHRGGVLPTLDAILNEPVPSARAVAPHVPPQVDAILHRALRKRASDRYTSAGEMRDALDDYLRRHGGAVTPDEVSSFMEQIFGQEDRNPLPENAAKLTGSFQSLTGSLSMVSGSFGPFGQGGARPTSERAPQQTVTIPQPRPRAAAEEEESTAPLWPWLVLAVTAASAAAGGLTWWLLR
ncbi:MAG TPA: serine/threonine-protein kinase, partial [Polyangiaceae bacterium LLY-WYZ-15_(1-7)]|nr:serine/threonine-protein kinase [Polyangiaceae bacterium LLY-WYZ-15_(1-7)]